jgi:sugar/nucleoside kinase (ribokinase family)
MSREDRSQKAMDDSPPAILCAGILVADIFVPPLPALPEAGQLLATDDFLIDTGGCAANVATGLSKLGTAAAVAGKVGKDAFGDFIVHDLAGKGIDTSHVTRSEVAGTSKTVILPVVGQDRRFIHTFGANADFSVAEIAGSLSAATRILYLGGYLILPGVRCDALADLLRSVKERGVRTILDVAVPRAGDASMELLEPILPHVDYFLPNDEEARALTGEKDPRRQAERFLGAGCGTAIITQGDRGTLLMDRRVPTEWVSGTRRVLEAPVFPVEYVDGSGAGDAFAAGFLLGLHEGWPAEETLRFASAVGASACRRLGCTTGVFTREEADAFLQRHALEIRETRR